MKRDRRCETCAACALRIVGDDVGECRRRAVVRTSDDHGDDGWPWVAKDEWCFEWVEPRSGTEAFEILHAVDESPETP